MAVKKVKTGANPQTKRERSAHAGNSNQSEVFSKIWNLSNDIKAGRLDSRINLEGLSPDDSSILESINELVDCMVQPLNVAAEYIDRISKGDIPPHITDKYSGDFNEIKNNLNQCIDGLQGLVEANSVLQRMSVNDNTVQVKGSYVGVFADVARAVNQVQDRIIHITETAGNIANGDLRDLDAYRAIGNGSGRRSEHDRLVPSMIMMMEKIKNLIDDANMLSKAAVEGKLGTRADVSRHPGDFREIIQGVNDTLDAVIGPLNVAAEYVDRISKGDIPPQITDNYNGDFNEIKNNLNQCIVGLGGLVEANAALQRMALNDYTVQVKGNYVGVFADLSHAVNQVQERISHVTETVIKIAAGDLSDYEAYRRIGNGAGRRSEQDRLAPAMIGMMEKIKALIEDANMLSRAAVEGKLATRADASRHQGDFRKIIEGVNDTLDAVIGPLNVAAEYVDRIAKGDVPPKITDSYSGDFNEIKNNVNLLIEAMNDATKVAEEIADGNLTVTVKSRSEQDLMMQALHRMIEKLTEVASNVQSVAGNVAFGSQEMSVKAEQVSQGATEQASSAEEVSSSMEQMTSNIMQNADNAQQTEKIAVKSAEEAREGGQAVSETVGAMKEIANKISIIEEIARQTNMLALNAAIEAARAGEHGKGFAVVAAEVRRLAERSQQAAGEINRLSASSVQIAEKAGQMLSTIVPAIQKTSALVQEINAASGEQKNGADQINKAIQQLDQVIQQNAAASEEMAATARELSGQADQLQESIAFFRMKGSGAGVNDNKQKMLSFAKSAVNEQRPRLAGSPHTGAKRQGESADKLKVNGKIAGVALDMSDGKSRGDVRDSEFERY